MASKMYVFVNSKVCGNQTGIQAAHAVARLVYKSAHDARIRDWMSHETLVILNGGTDARMQEIATTLVDHSYPNCTALFREPDMGGLLTAIAYIPTEDEIQTARGIQSGTYWSNGGPLDIIPDLIASSRSHRG